MRVSHRIIAILALLLAATLLAALPAAPAWAEDTRDGPPDRRAEQAERPLTLESIEVNGNSRTREEIIRARMDLAPGDAVDVDVFEHARLQLVDTGYFREVTFATRRGTTRGAVILVIDVEERGASFETGFGYDDLDGWFLTLLGLRVDNAFHTESRFQLGLRLGFRIAGLDASWDQQFSPGSRLGYNLRGYIYGRDQIIYGPGPTQNWMGGDWNRFQQAIANVGAEFSLHYDAQPRTRVWFGAKTRYVEPDSTFHAFDSETEIGFDELPPGLQPNIEGNVITGVFARAVHDSRDSENYPTRGTYAIVKLEANTSQIANDDVFTKTSVDLRRHFSLGGANVLSTRAYGGYITGPAPYYERFYIGGNYTIRGFEEWSLSFTGGDDAFWLVNGEFRTPLIGGSRGQPRLTGLLFVDAGQGWQRVTDRKIDVQVGVGYGFRLRLPWLGTLGVDAAVPLTDGRTGDPFRVHALLGFSF